MEKLLNELKKEIRSRIYNLLGVTIALLDVINKNNIVLEPQLHEKIKECLNDAKSI